MQYRLQCYQDVPYVAAGVTTRGRLKAIKNTMGIVIATAVATIAAAVTVVVAKVAIAIAIAPTTTAAAVELVVIAPSNPHP